MSLIVENGVLVAYKAEDGEASVTVPDEVEEIGDGAFLGAVALREVRLHGGIRRIGDGAFYGCSSLRDVVFLGDAPLEAGEDVFCGTDPEFIRAVREACL